jgi:hypothetical protein
VTEEELDQEALLRVLPGYDALVVRLGGCSAFPY